MSGFPLPTRIVKSSALSQYNLIFPLFPPSLCLSISPRHPLPGDHSSEIRTLYNLHRHVAFSPHVPR